MYSLFFYFFTTSNAFAHWLNHLAQAQQHFFSCERGQWFFIRTHLLKIWNANWSDLKKKKGHWKWRHTAKVQGRRVVAMCGSQSCSTAVTVCPVSTQRRRLGWNPLFLRSCELAEQETNEEWTESEQSDSSRLLTLLKHSSDTATESQQMVFFFLLFQEHRVTLSEL